MATGNSIWVSVEILQDGNCRQNIYECDACETISDLFSRIEGMDISNLIATRIFDSQKKNTKRETPINAPIRLMKEFACNTIQFQMRSQEISDQDKSRNPPNAFQFMMAREKEKILPQICYPKNEPDRMFNDIIKLLTENQVGWSPSLVDSVGKPFVQLLTKILWHITSHFGFFKERGASLNGVWDSFADRNDWRGQSNPKPRLCSTKLNDFTTKLSASLNSPWMNSRTFSEFRNPCSSLNRSLLKIITYLDGAVESTVKRQKLSEPARIDTENTALEHIIPNGTERSEFKELAAALQAVAYYHPLLLSAFEPEDRKVRYAWLENLALPFPVSLLRRAYGGNIGTMNFIWRIPCDEGHRDETQEMKLVLEINKNLPNFHSRQMYKDFVDRYSKIVKTPTSVLHTMYREISGDEGELRAEEKEIATIIGRFVSECDSSEILIDLRKMNGRPKSSKYDEFWGEIRTMFEEYQVAVHERRQNNVSYLPFAISIRELMDKVKQRRPYIAVPSHEWVRLQFTPINPYANTAMRYTAQFEIKYMVQRRQMRYDHPDSKFAQVTFKYLKEFAVRNKDLVRIIFLDDKAVIPVGNPGLPVSTNVRRHNKSLGASKTVLAAADHDWHVAGIVSSVLLCPEIPENVGDSFFNGSVIVTSKDRIFEPSSAIRHGRETGNILQDRYSENCEQLKDPILLLYTDGGGDHNVTHISVQLSLLCLFLELNLDMLIAVRTCPTQSWVNPAERCMYLLNLALQNVSLERGKMEAGFEDMIRNKTTMKDVREKAKRNEYLRDEFLKAMEPTIKTVNERFEAMSLKGEYIKTYKSASEVTIETLSKLIAEIDPNVDPATATKDSVSKLPAFQSFFLKHCLAGTYVFQVKKCDDSECLFCTTHPRRMSHLDYSTIDFLPYPMLDSSKQHYKEFKSVYGTETSEKDRPSLNMKMQTTDADVKNKSMLTVVKVRAIINCIDCKKPRCIFVGKALTPIQVISLQHIKDADMYRCGSSLYPEDHSLHGSVVVRTTLVCETPVEAIYFGATTLKFPNVCNHCGGASGAALVNDQSFKDLQKRFQRVRSICEYCKRAGKEPTTWGAMAAQAKKAKK